MTYEFKDETIGVLTMVALGVIAIPLGYAINAFKNLRYRRAWRPLLGIVDGVVESSVGGGAESRMRGKYKGHAVLASMAPMASESDGSNEFAVAIGTRTGVSDWSLEYKHKLWPLDSAPTLAIVTPDEGLRSRLDAAGLVGIMEQFGIFPDGPNPPVRYRVAMKSIEIQCVSDDGWILSHDRFRHLLDTLVELEAMNARVNTA